MTYGAYFTAKIAVARGRETDRRLSRSRWLNMKFSVAFALSMAGSASPFSFAGTALKATSTTASIAMTTGMGVNGFLRIGRLAQVS